MCCKCRHRKGVACLDVVIIERSQLFLSEGNTLMIVQRLIHKESRRPPNNGTYGGIYFNLAQQFYAECCALGLANQFDDA